MMEEQQFMVMINLPGIVIDLYKKQINNILMIKIKSKDKNNIAKNLEGFFLDGVNLKLQVKYIKAN